MPDTSARTIYLKDYRSPPWTVVHASLIFDLGVEETVVESLLDIKPQAPYPGELVLHGENLELLEIELDGQALAASRYENINNTLRIRGVSAACQLRTRVKIKPKSNTQLEGLYCSGELLLTQCEPEGFRRISFFIDQPDVMATWRITLRADQDRFPVLLANGNPISRRELEGGLHEAVWENPHPTPSYLFAIAAGDLAAVSKTIQLSNAESATLNVWSSADDISRCEYALEALERAIRWDEQRFGCVYDLRVFNIVAAHDFTMGAMENKGLNIFNARYILADEATATDDDFIAIESVIGHEYFHNWSGNRVTCRDWFQLSLKEGLTVFRDQEFTADLHSRDLKRIADVRILRSRQFSEDAGALSHPVRPDRYAEINNFYTATVYEKGAEIVRMLQGYLGEKVFRAGMDRYFGDNDGRAATVEDFYAAHSQASGRSLDDFMFWYQQSGTPQIHIHDDYDANEDLYTLNISQVNPATADQESKKPLFVPLNFALYQLPATAPTQPSQSTATVSDKLIELRQAKARIQWKGLGAKPLPVFNQGFAAPVSVHYPYSAEQLAGIAIHETDGFSRWDALQQLATGILLNQFEQGAAAPEHFHRAIAALIANHSSDPAFVAECLSLPDFDTLAECTEAIDVDRLLAASKHMRRELAETHQQAFLQCYESLGARAQQGLSDDAMAARALRNACLQFLSRTDSGQHLARRQFAESTRMTDRISALQCVVHFDPDMRETVLEQFRREFSNNPLVLDKSFAVQLSRPDPQVLAELSDLQQGEFWLPANPNRVRAMLGTFSRNNATAFHQLGGAGYRYLAEQIALADRLNSQVAARLMGAFQPWSKLLGERREQARSALRAMQPNLVSRDTQEQCSRLLGDH